MQIMRPRTSDFFATIRKSSLIKPDELDAFLDRLAAWGLQADEPMALARRLIAEGLLTRFQAEQLLEGRWRNFHLAGKYRVLEQLGIGPMSTVLLCEHMTMRRLVALKMLPADKAKDPATLARFHREARAAARLRHPNVVTVYDLDSVDGLDFLVCEFVDGSDLQRVVEATGPMSVDRAANCIGQAAEGLQHAYEMGLVHRDMKPANLVVDRAGTVKVLDLGLARLFQDPNEEGSLLNESGILLGTIDYLSPEQAVDSHDVDIRTDIYSLGATAFYLLSGRTLFEGASVVQKLAMHSHRPADRMIRELSGIPRGFADILIKMLSKDPNQRFQTPMEVAQAMALWTTEAVHVPSAAELPNLSPATRKAIEHSGSGLVSSMSRTPFGRTIEDSSREMMALKSVSFPAFESLQDAPVETKAPKASWLASMVMVASIALLLGVSAANLSRSNSASEHDSATHPRTKFGGRSSSLDNHEIPLIKQDRFFKVDLQSVASVVTTRPMFSEPGAPGADNERLVFEDWSPRTFNGVPFHLVDPKGDTVPNGIMLYSPQGATPPKMPSAVCLKVNTRAKAIHFLGGVSGWGAKSPSENPTTSMIVRLLYADGKAEDHPLQNGVQFSDFVQIADVPGSVLAFRLHNRHLRYFSIKPTRTEKITQIELVKGPDATAPIVMALTLEEPDR